MTFLGEPPAGGALLRARARLIHADPRTALCEAFVEDDAAASAPTARRAARSRARCVGSAATTTRSTPSPPPRRRTRPLILHCVPPAAR